MKPPVTGTENFAIPNAWVRLERKGAEFIGSFSSDGKMWTELTRVTLDIPGDHTINITDPINTINFLFLGTGNIPCKEAANANDDASLNITDPIYSLNFSFSGGPPPPAPGPSGPCGVDPLESPSNLGCDSYSKC